MWLYCCLIFDHQSSFYFIQNQSFLFFFQLYEFLLKLVHPLNMLYKLILLVLEFIFSSLKFSGLDFLLKHDLDFNRAFENDIKLVTIVSLVEDHLTIIEFFEQHAHCDVKDVLSFPLLEEGVVLEEVYHRFHLIVVYRVEVGLRECIIYEKVVVAQLFLKGVFGAFSIFFLDAHMLVG